MPPPVQHIVGKDRPPRVHIQYDVWTNGALEKVELPFVVGVLADLSGQPTEPLKPLKERNFTAVDRVSFSDFMKRQGARLAFKVDNVLTGEENTKLNVELRFNDMEDFEPDRVARQVEPLRELLEMRQRLVELKGRMEGNDQLERLLAEALNRTQAKLAQGGAAADSSSSTNSETEAPK